MKRTAHKFKSGQTYKYKKSDGYFTLAQLVKQGRRWVWEVDMCANGVARSATMYASDLVKWHNSGWIKLLD